MTSTALIIALIAIPLGFVLGQLVLNRSRSQRTVTPRVVEVRRPVVETVPPERRDTSEREAWDSLVPSPSVDAMAGKIERLRAERDDARTKNTELERAGDDLRAQIEGASAQLLAGTRRVERAEEVSRNAGARLVEALAERDEAVDRLQVEKAAHAETHRSLEGAENYLQLLIGHLDEASGTMERGDQADLVAQVAELRDTVGRLGQQMRTPAAAARR